jgi:hypothetical protein
MPDLRAICISPLQSAIVPQRLTARLTASEQDSIAAFESSDILPWTAAAHKDTPQSTAVITPITFFTAFVKGYSLLAP